MKLLVSDWNFEKSLIFARFFTGSLTIKNGQLPF
jgi:hypothetical protein